jgi:superfamily II DNA or RNA helicase
MLVRGDERIPVTDPEFILPRGVFVSRGRVALLEEIPSDGWLEWFQAGNRFHVPDQKLPAFLEKIHGLQSVPVLRLPAKSGWTEVAGEPEPRMVIERPTSLRASGYWQMNLDADIEFDYAGGGTVTAGDATRAVVDPKARRILFRDLVGERRLEQQALAAGFTRKAPWDLTSVGALSIQRRRLAGAVRALLKAGWQVHAEGSLLRRPGAFNLQVSSGIDWFDLEGGIEFDGTTASLPAILAALKKGDGFIVLDDGSQGLLPETWLKRYAPIAAAGEVLEDRIRFRPSQALLLDALLSEIPTTDVDETFETIRRRLSSFDGIAPSEPPPSFVGRLRDYQKYGLGWFEFLRDFKLHGCLADDMGLGKTVQVLALLESRRAGATGRSKASGRSEAPGRGSPSEKDSRVAKGPPDMRGAAIAQRSPAAFRKPAASLVVAPRSLVHNWIEEARRFTPKLRLLDHTGLYRKKRTQDLLGHDLIVTTYGTLRRDIKMLKEIDFDYAILDEAQAIKNASSQSAKACRLIRARHRLALTGTPVENHVGEIWSLFEFLNPGMLGTAKVFSGIHGDPGSAGSTGSATRASSPGPARGTAHHPGSGTRRSDRDAEETEEHQLLARVLRPFILRRTKQQVLKELPAKTEQVRLCEMQGAQKRIYEELRRHYRSSLSARIDRDGLNRSKIHVLEALLRLRQATCHPGLIDPQHGDVESAKLETLIEQIREVVAEGHRALVFSQFVALLKILRKRLDQESIAYEYLDGRTRKRAAAVHRFQADDGAPLFLISLKAGGQGLNLTAADYAFILDPWWNPAVEAQAIDRTHRIGQTKPVFAYRLICKGTVEEKILELQRKKRRLAEMLVGDENSLIKELSAEDLELLLR